MLSGVCSINYDTISYICLEIIFFLVGDCCFDFFSREYVRMFLHPIVSLTESFNLYRMAC